MIEYLSQTMINQWDRCPEQFRRRWIDGVVVPPGIAARIGTGVHKGAEVNHRAKLTSGADEPLSVIQDAARDGYVHSVKEGVFIPADEVSSAKTQIAEGIDTTVGLAKVYHAEVAPTIQPKLIEETIYLEVPDLLIPVRGTIDLLDANNNWHDIKTSAKKWPEGRADNEIQGTLYNELVRHRTGTYPLHLYYDILIKSGFRYDRVETTRTEEDWRILVRKMKMMLQTIEAGIFQPAQPGSWICSPKWCGFWWTCPYIPSHRKVLPK